MNGHVRLNRRELVRVINRGGLYAGLKRVIPITECVKISVLDGGVFSVESTDGKSYIKTLGVYSDYRGDMGLQFCVRRDDMLKYLKMISDEDVVLDIDNEKVKIRQSKGGMTFLVSNEADFPQPKEMPSDESSVSEVSVDFNVLKDCISKAKRFVGNDSLRPILAGVLMYGRNGVLCFSSSDTSQLYRCIVKGCETSLDRVVLSASFCDFILNTDNNLAEEIKIKIGDKNVCTQIGDTLVVCTLFQGKFPNIEAVIPNEISPNVFANRNEFVSALNRAVLASDTAGLATLNFVNDKVRIECRNFDFLIESAEDVACRVETDVQRICIKGVTFSKLLSTINDDGIAMSVTGECRPVILSTENEHVSEVYLQMPMAIKD